MKGLNDGICTIFDFDFEIFYWSGVRIHIYMLDYDGIFRSL